MPFSTMANDTISLVKPDGTVIENIKASVQPQIIFIFDDTLPIEENDKIYRKLPNSLVETYLVLDRGFHSKFHGIPGHYQIKVRKEGSIKEEKYSSMINIYNANGLNSRININSTDNSITYINDTELLFNELKKNLENITENEIKQKALQILGDLKNTKNTSEFLSEYQSFISLLANHMTIIAPFIPALTELIK